MYVCVVANLANCSGISIPKYEMIALSIPDVVFQLMRSLNLWDGVDCLAWKQLLVGNII